MIYDYLQFLISLFPIHQGNNKLEVNNLRQSDMSTDDEERVGGDTRRYEKKISNLMNEVGSLKNEVGAGVYDVFFCV